MIDCVARRRHVTKVVAIVNQKGGVGKTTTAINLASGLALSERKSLLLDLDPQSNSTRGLGYGADPERASIYDVLLGSEPLHGILLPTEIEKLSLAPSEPDLIGFEVELMGTEKREWRLRDALIGHDSFDLVLVDCPPSLGLLTVNALVAADGVLIPVQCEYLALEGVTQLIETLRRIRSNLNPQLQILGVVLTMFDERTNLSHQVVDDIRKFFGGTAYDTVIPRSVRLGEAPSFGKPIFLYDPRSKGAEAYMRLAQEFLQREEPPVQETAIGDREETAGICEAGDRPASAQETAINEHEETSTG